MVLFVGPSCSGKSSLLRAAGEQLGAIDAGAIELPDLPLADALPDAAYRTLPGQNHMVKAHAIAPVLTEFFEADD